MEPITNWAKLSRHDEVALYRNDVSLGSGHVDMIAADGTVFWIIQADGKGRTMVHHCDELTVFRVTSGNAKILLPVHYKI